MLLVANGAGLSGVYFDGQKYLPRSIRIGGGTRATRRAPGEAELSEYFGGSASASRPRSRPKARRFQQDVWKAISAVGFGRHSYSELALHAGFPGSARAGAPRPAQSIGIIVPCHRIVGSNGSLTGYAGGLDRKRALLALESEFRICCARLTSL